MDKILILSPRYNFHFSQITRPFILATAASSTHSLHVVYNHAIHPPKKGEISHKPQLYYT